MIIFFLLCSLPINDGWSKCMITSCKVQSWSVSLCCLEVFLHNGNSSSSMQINISIMGSFMVFHINKLVDPCSCNSLLHVQFLNDNSNGPRKCLLAHQTLCCHGRYCIFQIITEDKIEQTPSSFSNGCMIALYYTKGFLPGSRHDNNNIHLLSCIQQVSF